MKKMLIVFYLFSMISFNYGQECTTDASTSNYYHNNLSGSAASLNEPLHIKIYFWLMQPSSGLYDPTIAVNNSVTNLNLAFNPIKIYFDYCVFEFENSVESSYDDGINVYIDPTFSAGSAFGIPSKGCRVNIHGSATAHEVGHCLGLFHTFQGLGTDCQLDATHENTPTLNGNILVDGANCSTAGDLVCDTPADPRECFTYKSICDFVNEDGFTDFLGNPYIDPDHLLPKNTMSYNFGCGEHFTMGQNARMRDLIAAAPELVGIVRSSSNPTTIIPDYNTVLVSNTTIDEPTYYISDLLVKANVSLTINSDVFFAPNKGIIFEEGADLTVNGAKLDVFNEFNSCLNTDISTWKGMTFHTSNSSQTAITINLGSEINNADVALDIKGDESVFFYMNNADFINNRIALKASNNDFVTPFVRGCNFKLDSEYLPTSIFSQIVLENCPSMFISKCTFENNTGSVFTSSAITLFNNGLVCTGKSEFNGWEKAISVNSSSSKTAWITGGIFTGNLVSIDATEHRNIVIKGGTFTLNETGFSDTQDNVGARLFGCRSLRVFDNEFTGTIGDNRMFGLQVANVFNNNVMVNDNKFESLNNATEASSAGNTTRGLLYKCNEFVNNDRDIYAEYGMMDHGTFIEPIGNYFSQLNNGIEGSDVTVEGFNFKYYYSINSSEEEPIYTVGFIPTELSIDSDCEGTIVQLPPFTGSIEPYKEVHDDKTDEIIIRRETINKKLDNGDTEGLTQRVNSLSPSNAGAVIEMLASVSPWVSPAVGEMIIDNAEYFTSHQIANLYTSNPYWMSSPILYNYVNGENSPLSKATSDHINIHTVRSDAQSIAVMTLANVEHDRDVNITNAINFINTRKVIDYDLLREWFSYKDDYSKWISIAETHMTQKNYNQAISSLIKAASSYDSGSSESSDLHDYKDLLKIQFGIYTSDRDEWDMTPDEEVQFHSLAIGTHNFAPQKAKDILTYYKGQVFSEIKTRSRGTSNFKEPNDKYNRYGKLSVSPNPSAGIVMIALPDNYVDGTMKVYDMQGRLVKSFDSIPHSVNTSELNNGIYLLKVESVDKPILSTKFIKIE